MPFLICPYFTMPIVATKIAIEASIRNIRFFMETKPPASYPPPESLECPPRVGGLQSLNKPLFALEIPTECEKDGPGEARGVRENNTALPKKLHTVARFLAGVILRAGRAISAHPKAERALGSAARRPGTANGRRLGASRC